MLRVKYIVIPILLASVGCAAARASSNPKHTASIVTRQDEIFAKSEANYSSDMKSRDGASELERSTREHNMMYYKAQRVNVDACFAACLKENDSRKSEWDELQRMRETIRHICHTTGTHIQGRSDLIETDERSPSAHPRFVESNGHLEYRERRVDVVEIRPTWICPSESDADMLMVASKWMYDTPPELKQRPCSLIKTGVEMQGVALDVCLRWVVMPGGV